METNNYSRVFSTTIPADERHLLGVLAEWLGGELRPKSPPERLTFEFADDQQATRFAAEVSRQPDSRASAGYECRRNGRTVLVGR